MSEEILEQVTIQVPATVANLGPGYDCLGMALSLYNRVTLQRHDEGQGIDPAHPMIEEAAALFFGHPGSGGPAFGFSWEIEGEVPRSRGLGSSVTLRQGVIHGLNALCGSPLDREALFELCSTAEGHPDNAGPGVFGGFVVTGEGGQYFRFPVDPGFRLAVVIPDFEVETAAARSVLPESIPRREAARNTANASQVTAAFATRDYGKLRGAFVDYLHQRYRAHLVDGLEAIIAAGEKAGALGGFLCGSGPTMACPVIAPGDAESVLAAMLAAAPESIQSGLRGLVLEPDNAGSAVRDRSESS